MKDVQEITKVTDALSDGHKEIQELQGHLQTLKQKDQNYSLYVEMKKA